MIDPKDFLLGELLIRKGYISLAHIDEAIKLQEQSHEFLGSILIHLGYITEKKLLEVLSDQLGIAYVNLDQTPVNPEAIKRVPAKLAFHYRALPIELKNDKLTFLVSNPLDQRLADELETLVGMKINIAIGHTQQISQGLETHYGVGAAAMENMPGFKTSLPAALDERVQVLEAGGNDSMIVRLVNQLLLDAQKERATDIHFEPYADELRVRYRVDGILRDARLPADIKKHQPAIISRIKIMANLDIGEKRLPQDGRIKVKSKDAETDLRISVLPSPYGEAIVIRILSPASQLNLQKLGFSMRHLKMLEEIIKNPYGIILLTGPTGSGKTTTLYSCLAEINSPERKIITLEDPIEYQMRGILQIQTHPKIGLNFSQGLRHVLRHDPDVIMVGEIRDKETADITIRTALTGHLVFSTLHTNDASGAIARLIDMGIEPYLVASSVVAVIAQRLVRVIDPNQRKVLPAAKIAFPANTPAEFMTGNYYEAAPKDGKDTGFQGRTSIHEIMLIDNEMRELICRRVSSAEIRTLALKKGMQTLLENGLEKARAGITTVDEVLKVTRYEKD